MSGLWNFFPTPVPYPIGLLISEVPSVTPGTPSKDVFLAYGDTSGDIFQGLADTIASFDADEDTLWIPEGLTYAGNTMSPNAGTYSVWMKDGDYVVTWQKEAGGWNDLIVKGDSPVGKIEAVIPDDTIINTYSSGLGPTMMYGTAATDVFEFTSNTTGDVYKGQADTVKNFDEDHDFIHIPEGLAYGGATNSPTQGEYTVWEKDNEFVVTWYDNGYHDIIVEGDNPLGDILSGGDLLIV